MKSGDCSPDLIFYPGSDVTPYLTAENKYIYGRESIMSQADFRAGASRHSVPPQTTLADTPSVILAASGESKGGADGATTPSANPADTGILREDKMPDHTAATITGKGPETARLAAGEEKRKKRKKTKEELTPDPAPKPKVGTDAKAAAVNIDHRASDQTS